MTASGRIALRGRLVDQMSGVPLSGSLRVLDGNGQVGAAALDASGAFSLDVPRPAESAVTLVDGNGRTYGVDLSGITPTVQATPSGGRLLLEYGGDPEMQGQTPESLAAQARAEAVAARATAAAAQTAASTFAGTLAMVSATMQAALAAAGAAQTRRVGLVVGRAAVPSLAVNVDKPLPVSWSAPVVPSAAVALLEPTGSVLGQVTATVRADSVAVDGCSVLLRSPVLVAAGAGSVAVVAAYLT